MFIQNNGSRKVVGTVGDLQFDVLEYRLHNEYGAACRFRPLNFYKACWVIYEKEEDISELMRIRSHNLFLDYKVYTTLKYHHLHELFQYFYPLKILLILRNLWFL